MAEPTLVVDLGSTAVTAAIAAHGETRLLPEPSSRALRRPAGVLRPDGDGPLMWGSAAVAARDANPSSFLDDVRKLLPGDEGVHLLSLVIRSLHAEARTAADASIDRLTITAPASWPTGAPALDGLVAAGELAGFSRVELVSDAVAAAFSDDGHSADRTMLVCDLGGHQAGCAEVRIEGPHGLVKSYTPLPPGESIDQDLLATLRIVNAEWIDPLLDASGDAGIRGRFAVAALVRRLRHRLDDGSTAEDVLSPLAPSMRLRIADLQSAEAPLLSAINEAIRGHQNLLVVGGLARTASIAAAVRGAVAPEPELTVIRGASRWSQRANERSLVGTRTRRSRVLDWDLNRRDAVLTGWSVRPGESYAAGAIVAEARTYDDTVLTLRAPVAATLLEQRTEVGEPLQGVVAVVELDPAIDEDPGDMPWQVADLAGDQIIVSLDPARIVTIDRQNGRLGVSAYPLDDGPIKPESSVDIKGPITRTALFAGPRDTPAIAIIANSELLIVDLARAEVVARTPFSGSCESLHIDGNILVLVEVLRTTFRKRYRQTRWQVADGSRWMNGLRQESAESVPAGHPFRAEVELGDLGMERSPSPDGQWLAWGMGESIQVTPPDAWLDTDKSVFQAWRPAGKQWQIGWTSSGNHLWVRTSDGSKQRLRAWHW